MLSKETRERIIQEAEDKHFYFNDLANCILDMAEQEIEKETIADVNNQKPYSHFDKNLLTWEEKIRKDERKKNAKEIFKEIWSSIPFKNHHESDLECNCYSISKDKLKEIEKKLLGVEE